MINQIISFSIKNKFIIGLFTVALITGGLWCMNNVPIDVVPDITNNQVQVITQAPNLGTEDIEQFVTYPVEISMANLPGVKDIRSISRFGLSVVTIVFKEDMGTYLPRQLVAEKLTEVKEKIPEGFGKPSMGPISTGLGEIYQYTLKVDSAYQDQYSSTDLRTIQDWIIRKQMAMVPGVVEINAFGGHIKQYEVAVDPDELKAIGLTISDLFHALKTNNANTGGAYIEKGHYANFIRGEGLATSLKDIEDIVIKNEDGLPVTIKDVADVNFRPAVRYGAFTKDGNGEAVGGMVLMLKGANSNQVIQDVKTRIAKIQKSLPEGVSVEPFLDRSNLISNTTATIRQNLTEGALIVVFVLVFLLGNWRGGIIAASTIPLSLLFAFVLMYVFDVWANLMSLGAIDFGIIIDGAVIIVEGTVFMLHEKVLKQQPMNARVRDEVASKASNKMMNTAFFGQLIILIVFIPILALEGVEGKMFHPMALTFIFAMIGVMILCLTYVPMMSALFITTGKKQKTSPGDRLIKRLKSFYQPLLNIALKRTKWVIGAALILFVLAVFAFTRMGGEFIPQLDEGDIAFHVILKPGSSLSESVETSTKVENIILDNFPEVKHAMTRFGVADVPTDPMPMDLGDCFLILKPKDEWVSADTKEELIAKIKKEISVIPGVTYEFTQPIEMRFNELLTGVREDIAVKLFGEDLDILANKADEMGELISGIEGVADLKVEATTSLPQMTIKYKRHKLAQYGLSIDDINTIVRTSFAGGKAGVIFEGEKRFDLVVRLDKKHRKSIDDLKNLFVRLPNDTQIPLKEVADISYESGPMQISRDNTNRRTYVGINVRGRDIKSLVEEIQVKLDNELDLPPGYYTRIGGAFENLKRATNRLQIVVPIALGLIFLLIFFALRSFKQTIMIYMAIPLAAIGGVGALWLRDMPFSISAGIGFIVLFGVAVLNGLVLISAWNELKEEGVTNLNERIHLGTKRRLRPILLTALTDIFGFLPMAISTSSGAEVQRPLATVVIGGMITATLLTLFILPVLYQWIERRHKKMSLNTIASLLTGGLLLLFIYDTKAQTPEDVDSLPAITIEKATHKAISDYPQIRASQLEVENQQALKKTAWNLGRTNVFTGGEELGTGSQDVYTTIGVQQQNIAPFTIGPKHQLQKKQVNLAETSLHLSEVEIKYNVKTSYGKLYAAKKRYELYQRLDSTFKEFQRASKVRYETEETSKLAYLAASNKAKQMTIEKNKAYRDYRIALQQLNRWLVGDTLFTVSDTVPSEELALQHDSLMTHPLLRVAGQRVAIAKQEIKQSKANYLPKINLQYGLQEIGGRSGFYQYQMALSVPLFFMKQQGLVQSNKIEYQIAREQLQQTKREFQNEYHNAIQTYLKWKESWEYYTSEALVLAKEQRTGATTAYHEGAIDYVTYLQNMKDAMQVELETWNAFEQYLISQYKLAYFLNK